MKLVPLKLTYVKKSDDLPKHPANFGGPKHMKSHESSTVLENLGRQKLESIASAAMVIIGIALPILDPSNKGLLLAGSVLTTLGGAMFGTLLSSSRERHRAEFEKEVDPMLDSISRTLGEAVQQLDALVLETNEGIVESDTAMARVSVVLPTLRGAITDVLRVGSKSLDLTHYFETQQELKTLSHTAKELQGELTEGEVDHEKVAKLAQQIGMQAVSIASRTEVGAAVTETETVRCPNCSGENSVQLSVNPGATAMPWCQSCRIRFNVHRGRDGVAFTRMPPLHTTMSRAPQILWREFEVGCPECSQVIPVNVPEGGNSATRFCVHCGHRVTVDAAGSMISHDSRPLVRSAELPGAGMTQAFCAEHNFFARTFTRVGDRAFGVCVPGAHLVYRTPWPETGFPPQTVVASQNAAAFPATNSSPPDARLTTGNRASAIQITCPNCANPLTFRPSPNGGSQKRWCAKCEHELAVSEDGRVSLVGPKPAKATQQMRVDDFGRTFLTCPDDGAEAQSFFQVDGATYSTCSRCQQPLVFRAIAAAG